MNFWKLPRTKCEEAANILESVVVKKCLIPHFLLLCLVIVAALLFDYINGFH
jgi:hypothetical protein